MGPDVRVSPNTSLREVIACVTCWVWDCARCENVPSAVGDFGLGVRKVDSSPRTRLEPTLATMAPHPVSPRKVNVVPAIADPARPTAVDASAPIMTGGMSHSPNGARHRERDADEAWAGWIDPGYFVAAKIDDS